MSDDAASIFNLVTKQYKDALSRQIAMKMLFAATPLTNQRRVYGPPAPRIDTDGATFELQDGRIMCIGAGWEADAGPITRCEAEDIIGMLTWALESDLLDE